MNEGLVWCVRGMVIEVVCNYFQCGCVVFVCVYEVNGEYDEKKYQSDVVGEGDEVCEVECGFYEVFFVVVLRLDFLLKNVLLCYVQV